MEKTQESLNEIKTYLETSPDLNVYDYQEWDQQTEDFARAMNDFHQRQHVASMQGLLGGQ